MAVQEYRAYFVERERRPEFVDAFFRTSRRRLATWPPTAGRHVYLDPGTYSSPATRFVAWHYLERPARRRAHAAPAARFPPREPLAGDAFLLSRARTSRSRR